MEWKVLVWDYTSSYNNRLTVLPTDNNHHYRCIDSSSQRVIRLLQFCSCLPEKASPLTLSLSPCSFGSSGGGGGGWGGGWHSTFPSVGGGGGGGGGTPHPLLLAGINCTCMCVSIMYM